MEGKGRFARTLRSVYLHNSSAREAADAERNVKGDRASRDDLHGSPSVVAEAHHGTAAELPFDLRERGLQGLLPVPGPKAVRPVVRCHVNSRRDRWVEGHATPCRRYAPPVTMSRALGSATGRITLTNNCSIMKPTRPGSFWRAGSPSTPGALRRQEPFDARSPSTPGALSTRRAST